jgi:signal transduction histidine kinase
MESPDESGRTVTPQEPEKATFAVDTGLFRELGELLVGRDSTALAELIKNAYDADASFVRVHGQRLGDPERGLIEVQDDGTGITLLEFHRGFLRVAARTKETHTRRSPVYGRRYTGEKGIGRLAAHKLAALLEVRSQPNRRPGGIEDAIEALIDWDKIEAHETLDDTGDAILVFAATAGIELGTSLRLSRLRKAWRERDRQQFFREATSLTAPDLLVSRLPDAVVADPLLFTAASVRDVDSTGDPGFRVDFSGDFAGGESLWELLAAEIEWILEMRCDGAETDIVIAPATRTVVRFPAAHRVVLRLPREKAYVGPAFEVRILIRRGTIRVASLRNFAIANAGVRVYMEGFRVLPYGDVPRDDWLSVAQRYVARTSAIPGLDEELAADVDDEDDRPGLTTIPPQNIYGAVYLTERGAPNLKMLVNREGFVPNESFDALVEEITAGISILTRERAAASRAMRQERRQERERRRRESLLTEARAAAVPTESPPLQLENRGLTPVPAVVHKPARPFASAQAIGEVIEEAAQVLRFAREQVATRGASHADEVIQRASEQIDTLLHDFKNDFGEDLSLLRTLASIGTQLTIFAHEVRGLVGGVTAVEAGLIRLKESGVLRRGTSEARHLAELLVSIDTIRRSLERQTAYLSDAVSLDARRRRSAQRLAEVFDRSVALLQAVIERDGIIVQNDLPRALKTPPMFRAELQAVFTNLLTNAIKAAGQGGDIWARAEEAVPGERLAFRIENTGRPVDLRDAERWFQPFQSTSSRPDATLGQGIGLGLPITRSILDQYNASIFFVPPSEGFSTAVQVSFGS